MQTISHRLEGIKSGLEKNILVVTAFAVVGMLSTVVGLVTGWSEFWETISGSILIPIPILIIGTIIYTILILNLNINTKKKLDIDHLEIIRGKNFGRERVEMDGKKFIDCTFDASELYIKGSNIFVCDGCSFYHPLKLTFADDASDTVSTIRAMVQSGLFEQYFNDLFPPQKK